jgi:hypothetical protein
MAACTPSIHIFLGNNGGEREAGHHRKDWYTCSGDKTKPHCVSTVIQICKYKGKEATKA